MQLVNSVVTVTDLNLGSHALSSFTKNVTVESFILLSLRAHLDGKGSPYF